MNMKRNQESAEVTIQIDYQTQTANLCVAEWSAIARKFQRLYAPPKKLSRSADGKSNHEPVHFSFFGRILTKNKWRRGWAGLLGTEERGSSEESASAVQPLQSDGAATITPCPLGETLILLSGVSLVEDFYTDDE